MSLSDSRREVAAAKRRLANAKRQASNINSEIAIAQKELEKAQALEKWKTKEMAAREAKRDFDKLNGQQSSAVSSSRNNNRNLRQRTLNSYPTKPRPQTTRLLPSNNKVSEDESSGDEEQAPKQRNKETKKRKRFTKEENKYIRRGVRRFAVPGEQIPWTDIRDYYLEMNGVFGDRTATNIRDRWRNMNK